MVVVVLELSALFESAFERVASTAAVGVYRADCVVAFEPAEDELEEAKEEVAPAPVAPDEALDCK
jgi:hypothetical protein